MGGLLASSVHAQYADEGNEPELVLQEGAWALQFQIRQHLTLSSFQGAAISAKKQLSPRRAFRLGMSVEGRYRSESEEQDGEEEPGSSSTNSQSIFLNAQYIGYAPLRNAVAVYYGAGPSLGFDRNRSTQENSETNREQVNTSTYFSIGVEGALGVEWFVRSNISLTAEYNAGLDYSRRVDTSSIEQPDVEDRESKTMLNSVGLDSEGVRLGVSVYF